MSAARRIYSVAPRYSAGSPAWLDEATAAGVARDEREAHAAALAGYAGLERQAQAAGDGALRAIVLVMRERGGRWTIEDALTGERWQEVRLDKVPLGGSCWLYGGRANEHLAGPPARRISPALLEHADGRYEDVRDPRLTPVLVALAAVIPTFAARA